MLTRSARRMRVALCVAALLMIVAGSLNTLESARAWHLLVSAGVAGLFLSIAAVPALLNDPRAGMPLRDMPFAARVLRLGAYACCVLGVLVKLGG